MYCRFRKDLVGMMTQVMNFHCKTGSAILINAYPFFAYKANPNQVSLDFVLFQSSQGILDTSTKLRYDNMLFAQIDAVHYALADIGFKNMTVHVSETGWPSRGDADEIGATPENAKKYNGNLIKVISQKKGTPLRPDSDLKFYVFALFNENLKPGPLSERYYGLFNPDGSAAYSLGIAAHKDSSGKQNTSTGSGSGSGSGSGGVYGLTPSLPGSPNGYLSITSGSVSHLIYIYLVLSKTLISYVNILIPFLCYGIQVRVGAPAALLLSMINLIVLW